MFAPACDSVTAGSLYGIPCLGYPAQVGGVSCQVADVAAALAVLTRSPGVMVRQPLARHGCLLAACDYHAAAAPYRPAAAAVLASAGRGAAGRALTKNAFCAALSAVLEAARSMRPEEAFAALARRAWLAFGSDCGYGVEIARAAVALLAREGRAPGLDIRDSDLLTTAHRSPVLGIAAV